MASTLCVNCGKSPLGTRAGSITSYFFKHSYCQCNLTASERKPGPIIKVNVCSSCGKSREAGDRLGSITSYLFQDLRCRCGGRGISELNGKRLNQPDGARTQTASRVAYRKQTTESFWRNKATAIGSDASSVHVGVLADGTVVGGVFLIVSLIGVGGMGCVYLAEHQTLRKRFALKVMATESVNKQNWLRFKAEAQTIASFNHETFVKVYDLGIHENSMPFYSMDYLQGRSLEEVLVDDGPLQELDAIDIYLQLLDGLAYAHRNGIIHRDLKPANIMLCATGSSLVVKILDFGISKLVGSADGKTQHMTVAGEICGSPYYMSPEQCSGAAIDLRSDIYSIGCSLFETLTGCVPFEGSNSFETMLMHQEAKAPELGEMPVDGEFSPSIIFVVAKCLAKLPEDRYQSAKELAVDLSRVKEGRDVRSYSHNTLDRFNSEGGRSWARVEEVRNQPFAPGLSKQSWLILSTKPLLIVVALVGLIVFSFSFNRKNVSVRQAVTKSSPDQAPFSDSLSQSFNSGLVPDGPALINQHRTNLEKALANLERQYGANDLRVTDAMSTLAYTNFNDTRYKQAQVLFERLGSIYLKNLGPSHQDSIGASNGVALCCQYLGQNTEAEKRFKNSLEVLESKPGSKSKALAVQLNLLATFYRGRQKFDLAESMYKRSLELDPLGLSSNTYRSSRENYAALLRATKREREAVQLESQGLTLRSVQGDSPLPSALPTSSVVDFLNDFAEK